jgi:cellobiose phosphorylase
VFEQLTARNIKMNAEMLLRRLFKEHIAASDIVDSIFTDGSHSGVFGVAGLQIKVPAILELLKIQELAAFLLEQACGGCSVMVRITKETIEVYKYESGVKEIYPPSNIADRLKCILSETSDWAGKINGAGEHEADLFTPSPGPHFYVNLLIGNRIGYPIALQTTPKSVVDRFGGGSFRSHADTQVLATRWDMRQEENGFPANRQFYLVENYKKIFYSAGTDRKNIVSAKCRHSQNYTEISYITSCGLNISRLIFILPQMEGLPAATEVQRIEIRNNGSRPRKLRIVYTGMFGSAVPGALFEDVLYSNIVMQSRILRDADGSIIAVSPDYCPEKGRKDLRFHSMMLHNNGYLRFAKEFCVNYNEFVGNGTLQEPEGLLKLSNNLCRKGPGFFAVANEISLQPGEKCFVDQFTGIVSEKANSEFNEDTLQMEIAGLIDAFSEPDAVNKAFQHNQIFLESYSRFIQLHSNNSVLNTYVNKNLPFQVLYQTFVSRSFCQTQKGYREIGFREIQDIYASMYYFTGMGRSGFVKQLLEEWCSMIFEFGYAYHNFYWEGKEPGKWSDDQLWFVQAVYRYISLTGDTGLLDEECVIAGTEPEKKRTVYETIKAIIQYSAKISVGKHGLPLIDYADWNDCLKLDSDYINGIEKERKYKKQIEAGGIYGEPLDSDYSESVMNAFLLKLAIGHMIELSCEKSDSLYIEELQRLNTSLNDNIQTHAWKDNFFARVLFNRYKGEYSYLGAKGDNLSASSEVDGSYFLNSFSWSILSDCADDSQIEAMLNVIESKLRTPYGLKLVTPIDLGKVSSNTATAEYFQGDRENGGVFKHACMMSVTAMFKAAKKVGSQELAIRLSRLAYWLIDIVLPYKTMENPFAICGNPRFCTQYNNSETGENTGPMLSGTSSWLTLALISLLGIEFNRKSFIIDPVLREEQESISYTINMSEASYIVSITKPKGFYRIYGNEVEILFDGIKVNGNTIAAQNDYSEHKVCVCFK